MAMRLAHALAHVGAVGPQDLSGIRRHIDPEWIESALDATGTATIRKRRLPAVQVVWLVIGMALFRNRAIAELVHTLDLALPGRSVTVARSAVPQARARLGAEPLAWLFTRCADAWAHTSADRHRWRGLALYGVDGSTLRVADSDENREYFTCSKSARGSSGYPLLRLVGLMALRSHLLASVAFGPYDTGEGSYATELWSSVPDNSLTIVDRGFFAANILVPLARDGVNRHWLVRAKKNTSWKVLQQLGPSDMLVEMKVSHFAKKKDPTLSATWTARAIRYQRKGFRPQTLLTSMTDAERYPRDEVATLYHERWELELGYDEIKTKMLDREETLRSKSSEAVTQELWGVLIAYNLVRFEMEIVANQAKVLPTRISFVAALHLIVDEWIWLANTAPGAIPSRLRDLSDSLQRYLLPPRRSERSYPRAVKIKMSNYPRKRRSATRKGAK
jgi:hypothetical protein